MNLNKDTVFIRQSSEKGSLGGSILDSSDEKRGLEDFRVLLNAEDAFFNTTFYRVFYVKNISDETITNVEVTINGGPVRYGFPLDVDITGDNKSEVLDNKSWTNHYYMEEFGRTFVDVALERFQLNKAPFNNIKPKVLSAMPGSTRDEQFLAWLEVNQFNNAFGRSSVLNQIKFGLLPSPRRVSGVFKESGVGVEFNLNDIPFNKGEEKIKIPNDLKGGEYWSFFVKVDSNFVPTANIVKDVGFLQVSWQEYKKDSNGHYILNSRGDKIPGELHHSPLSKLVVSTNYTVLSTYHEGLVESLYNSYPPFFLRHEDE